MMSFHELVELVLSSLEGGNSRALFDYTLPLVALHQRAAAVLKKNSVIKAYPN
jgi:hypothetical protein